MAAKKKRGRPAGEPSRSMTVRVPCALLDAVDKRAYAGSTRTNVVVESLRCTLEQEAETESRSESVSLDVDAAREDIRQAAVQFTQSLERVVRRRGQPRERKNEELRTLVEMHVDEVTNVFLRHFLPDTEETMELPEPHVEESADAEESVEVREESEEEHTEPRAEDEKPPTLSILMP